MPSNAPIWQRSSLNYDKVKAKAEFLCELAYRGRLQDLIRVLKHFKEFNFVCRGGPPLLHAAAGPNDRGLLCLEYLLQAGADVAVTDLAGNSAVHAAAVADSRQCVVELANAAPDLIDLADRAGNTPLMRAAAVDNSEVVKELLLRGANPLASNQAGETVLDFARNFGAKTAYRIIEESLEVCGRKSNEKSENNVMTKEQLPPSPTSLNHSMPANFNKFDNLSWSLHNRLHWHRVQGICNAAAVGNLPNLIKLINPITVNMRYRGWTPLMWLAACTQSVECAHHLMLNGADASAACQLGKTAFHLAAEANNTNVLIVLFYYSPKLINSMTKLCYTPLMSAVGYNNADAAYYLVSFGADINSVNKFGNTAANLVNIYNANECKYLFDNLEMVAQEVNAWQTVNARDADIVCQMAQSGQFEELKKLASPENVNGVLLGSNPLLLSMRSEAGSREATLACARHLLGVGADANSVDEAGNSGLHEAARIGNTRAIMLMHRQDSRLLNLPSKSGDTPLMLAAESGSLDAVKLLIQLGADVTARNQFGETAANIAARVEALLCHNAIAAAAADADADADAAFQV